jgi:hypothetical protein
MVKEDLAGPLDRWTTGLDPMISASVSLHLRYGGNLGSFQADDKAMTFRENLYS